MVGCTWTFSDALCKYPIGKIALHSNVAMCRWRRFSVFVSSSFSSFIFVEFFDLKAVEKVTMLQHLLDWIWRCEKLRYIVKASSFTRNIRTQISRTAKSSSYLSLRTFYIGKWKTSFGLKNFSPFSMNYENRTFMPLHSSSCTAFICSIQCIFIYQSMDKATNLN